MESLSFKIPSIEDAKKDITSYQITRTFLGYSLSYIDGDASLLISYEDYKDLDELFNIEEQKDEQIRLDEENSGE